MPEVAGSITFARLGFFRYETGALSHQFEAESTVRFFHVDIMEGAHRIVPGFNHNSRVKCWKAADPQFSRENDATQHCLSLSV